MVPFRHSPDVRRGPVSLSPGSVPDPDPGLLSCPRTKCANRVTRNFHAFFSAASGGAVASGWE